MGCPYRTTYGDAICIDGNIWELTYSEMAPPDSRQYRGPCPHCTLNVGKPPIETTDGDDDE